MKKTVTMIPIQRDHKLEVTMRLKWPRISRLATGLRGPRVSNTVREVTIAMTI